MAKGSKGKKKEHGRPPHTPTPESRADVETRAGLGASAKTIAVSLSIDVKTLRKHYAKELDNGRPRARLFVEGELMKKVKTGSLDAIKFWLTHQGGRKWRPQSSVEVTGKGGAPLGVMILPPEKEP